MTDDDHDMLRRYLARGYEALRWKLEGLSEYDLRRPLVPSGTNLLGLVKHVAFVSSGYFGDVFGRPTALPPYPESEPNADMWATADESAEYVLGLLDTAAAEADAALADLSLDAVGRVPWWGRDVTLHWIVVHMIAELNRHAGHADIVRELIDGAAGLRPDVSNMPDESDGAGPEWWAAYRARLQDVADSFR